MSKNVVSISVRDTMAHAAKTLCAHAISGVPIVDERERISGVLSALDFVKTIGCTSDDNRSGKGQLTPKAENGLECTKGCEGDLVCLHMTPVVQSIASNQSLLAAARTMCNKHIHRLPVLDDQNRTIGIITALDVVAALVNALEE